MCAAVVEWGATPVPLADADWGHAQNPEPRCIPHSRPARAHPDVDVAARGHEQAPALGIEPSTIEDVPNADALLNKASSAAWLPDSGAPVPKARRFAPPNAHPVRRAGSSKSLPSPLEG